MGEKEIEREREREKERDRETLIHTHLHKRALDTLALLVLRVLVLSDSNLQQPIARIVEVVHDASQ